MPAILYPLGFNNSKLYPLEIGLDAGSAPTFGGLEDFVAQSDGSFSLEWSQVTAGTCTAFDIYVKADNGIGIFDAANYHHSVDNLVLVERLFTLPNRTYFLQGTDYFCAVKASNDGIQDSNTEVISQTAGGRASAFQIPVVTFNT